MEEIIATDGTIYQVRKEIMDGIKVVIWRFKCNGCGGILDAYYLDKDFVVPQLLKMVEVKIKN